MEEGLLSLKWNNHKSTFFHVLSILREKHTYTDVTLACDGRLYPAHKFVLSTCSEYFSDIFTSTSGNNIVIVLKDVRRQDLEYLLDYMYLGQVDVAQSELTSLIKTAECLRIKGLAIPDDEPQQTSRRGQEERDREGSPPSKKKRHLIEEDRTSSISSNNTTNRIPHVTLPPPSQQQAVLQRLQQAPLPQTAQAPPTSQAAAKSHPSPLPHSLASSQVPRSLQVPTSPLLPTSVSQPHPPLASPTQSTSLPVIKQEVADPPETPDVFMNESYDETDTKPDVSDSRHLEQDVAIAGPSGLQGSSDNWDGDNDLAGFAGSEGYSEGGMEDQGDSEVQGERQLGAASRVPQGRRYVDYGNTSAWVTSKSQTSTPTTMPVFSGHTSKSSPSSVSYHVTRVDSVGHGVQGNIMSVENLTEASPCISPNNSNLIESGQGSWADTPKMGPPVEELPMEKGEADVLRVITLSEISGTAPMPARDPLECPWCLKVLSKASNLKVHIRRHTGEKPYRCLFCPYTAAQKIQVVNHMNARHQASPSSFL